MELLLTFVWNFLRENAEPKDRERMERQMDEAIRGLEATRERVAHNLAVMSDFRK